MKMMNDRLRPLLEAPLEVEEAPSAMPSAQAWITRPTVVEDGRDVDPEDGAPAGAEEVEVGEEAADHRAADAAGADGQAGDGGGECPFLGAELLFEQREPASLV